LIDALAPDGPALVIVRGHRGAGRTTLLRYLADVARLRKHPLVRLEGASGMSAVPYGAMAELLPFDAIEALTSPESGHRTIAIIDDADRLDEASAAAIAVSVRDGRTLHVISLRSGRHLPAPIDDLLTGEPVVALELRPLDRATVQSVVEAHLGAPISKDAAGAFTDFSAGHPFALAEALQIATDEGLFVRSMTAWGLSARLTPSSRLREVTQSTLRSHAPAGCWPNRGTSRRRPNGSSAVLDRVWPKKPSCGPQSCSTISFGWVRRRTRSSRWRHCPPMLVAT